MSSTKKLGISDHGSTVVVSPGDQIEIRLAENPTTGYRWHLRPITDLAVDVQDSFAPGGSNPGAGGERIMVLGPRAPGRAEVRLDLRRSWEPTEKAIQHFAVSIVAQ